MRHRAPSPIADQWRRVPRAAARSLGALARLSPLRAVAALMVTLGLGAGAFVAVASVGGIQPQNVADPPVLGERPSSSPSRSEERSPLPTGGTGSGAQSHSTPGTTTAEPGETGTPARKTPTPSGAGPTPPLQTPGLPSVGTGTPTPDESPRQSTSPTLQDRTPPDTSLAQRVRDGDLAVFSLSASEPASFSCSLDGGAYRSCDSVARFSGLEPGWHTLAVRAIDDSGNADPTPATVRWLATGHAKGDR
jgi:hypothetical protein